MVISDNASTDHTAEVVDRYPQVCYFRNETNIGGPANLPVVLNLAQGKYILFCLDKDYIKVDYLVKFIQKLEVLPQAITIGQLKLNAKTETNDTYYTQGLSAVCALGYTCEHPSGMLIKVSALRESGIIDVISKVNPDFPFNADVIKAHLAMLGGGCRINMPLIDMYTRDDFHNEVSYSYSAGNIWFFPDAIRNRVAIFMRDCLTLGLASQKQLKTILKKIYRNRLFETTSLYRWSLLDRDSCVHYGIPQRNVGVWELFQIHSDYAKNFLKQELPVSRWFKYRIIVMIAIVWWPLRAIAHSLKHRHK